MNNTTVPDRWRHLLAIGAVTLLLCMAALLNRQPFFYPDTPTYIRGAETGIAKLVKPGLFRAWMPAVPPNEAGVEAGNGADADRGVTVVAPKRIKPLTSVDDKVVLAGRSVYYGALLYVSYLTSDLWLAVIVQALCVAYVLHLLIVRLWGLSVGKFAGVAAALSVFTPLGIYAGLLMPDIFAPLVILTIGMLSVYWQRLRTKDRWASSAILLFGVCAHSSHLALAGLMLLIILAARFLTARWRNLPLAGMVLVAACVVGGVVAEWAFTKAVTVAMGEPPLRLPHPMGRLIDMGPGTEYLRKHCPQSGYAACAYVKNYPTSWDDFLFSTDPAKGVFALADASTKRRLSNEQIRFVADVVRYDFGGVVLGLTKDIVKQVGNFGVDIWGYSDDAVARYAGRVPDAVFTGIQRSRPSLVNDWLTASTNTAVLSSLALAFIWWRKRIARAERSGQLTPGLGISSNNRRFKDFSILVVTGVLCNAVLCAVLASSLDRFQARVVWLIPFLALAVSAGATARIPVLRSRPMAPAAIANCSANPSTSSSISSPPGAVL